MSPAAGSPEQQRPRPAPAVAGNDGVDWERLLTGSLLEDKVKTWLADRFLELFEEADPDMVGFYLGMLRQRTVARAVEKELREVLTPAEASSLTQKLWILLSELSQP